MRTHALDEQTPQEALEAAIALELQGVLQAPGTPPSWRIRAAQERDTLVRDILHEVRGLGPIEPLLAEEGVTEIMVNGPHRVYVEREGRLTLTEVAFRDVTHLRTIIDRIVSAVGRRVDESTPACDARLADGSRIHAILPPLAIDGPCLTIRKFRRDPIRPDELLAWGSWDAGIATFLRRAVESKLNILISGGTGSGKTTLLNVLSGFIPPRERLVTIEDAAELQLQQPHVVRLETRAPNLEGQGAIPQAELLRHALRMRPDRIILGEVRGAEALAMLQAMNTGHEGSLATLHANSVRDALSRLETMVLMAGHELPLRAIREQIRSAIDLVVQVERGREGRRRVTGVAEVVGMEGDIIQMQELHRWVPARERHEATGIRPAALDRLIEPEETAPC
jgi:pilus assembly protein CpaF